MDNIFDEASKEEIFPHAELYADLQAARNAVNKAVNSLLTAKANGLQVDFRTEHNLLMSRTLLKIVEKDLFG